jgi:hypothetical protein
MRDSPLASCSSATGERIRDKVAASKKKGMWMGGYVHLTREPASMESPNQAFDLPDHRALGMDYSRHPKSRILGKFDFRAGSSRARLVKTPYFVHFAKFESSVGGIVSEWPTNRALLNTSVFTVNNSSSFRKADYRQHNHQPLLRSFWLAYSPAQSMWYPLGSGYAGDDALLAAHGAER